MELLKQALPLLMDWFQTEARELPWRSNPKPYYVWLSEIMLQQTRVETVKPYFKRFLERFPDIKALSQAEEEELLKLWEGLGYYSRVRNLKKSALICMEQYGGNLPDSYEKLKTLPGIGNYTAGAIASIAYGKLVPAVDGNVLRVISRLTADKQNITKPQVKRQMEEILKTLLEAEKPDAGIFNQALMELGAIVCLPNGKPYCLLCPWRDICLAHLHGSVKEIPVKSAKKERKIQNKTVFVVRYGDLRALKKRPDKGLLAGLYELPNTEGHLSQEEAVLFWKNNFGYEVTAEHLESAKHIFSHIEWNMKAYLICIKEENTKERIAEESNRLIFIPKELIEKQYAIPAAFQTWKNI